MDVSLVSNPFTEDADMSTWPRLEDALDKSDCSKQLCDLPHHIAKDCLMNDQVAMMMMKRDGNASRATAEAAMTMGAGRAAGLLSQAGADAFTLVRTSVLHPCSTTPCSEIAFPYPTAQPRASLHFSSTSMDSDRQPFVSAGKEAFNPCVCSKAATSSPAIASSRKPVLCPLGVEQSQQAMGFCSPPTFCPNQDVNMDNKVEHCLRDVSSLSGSEITALDKRNASLQTVDIPSSWGTYLCTNKRAKEISARTPKGQSSLERTDQQSEVVHVAAKAGKPPSGRSSLMKRTRAAEIHNLSERKRRDKINLRMKALQELIPNANKTDKASLLDEAIEYMKLLQAQVQFMSMRTGMAVSPMMMPLWMQYFPHTGMRMGTSTGMACDGTASDGSCIPVHGLSVSNPGCYGSQFQSSSTSSVVDDPQDDLQSCYLYEPLQAISSHQLQHPIQFSTQSNAHMFSPLVQLQHQTQDNDGSSGI